MLKKLLEGIGGYGGGDQQAASSPPRSAFDPDELKTFASFFPIGKKLRYYPEFKKDIIFDTVLVAYCVDGEFIYSCDHVVFDSEGNLEAFLLGDGSTRRSVTVVKRLQVLVPDTSDQELSLDYNRRAAIGRNRQFNKGNYISLQSNGGALGQATMDTEVAKRIVLPDGPYANVDMVLLTPELDSIDVIDQRGKHRTKTCVPVTMAVADNRLHGPCTIIDVSDGGVRIRVRDGATMPEMDKGTEAILEVSFGEREPPYQIKGVVIRRSPEACVVSLDALMKDGRFASFSQLDRVELKSRLLNFGK